MMLSADALHLGPLMLPWTLLLVITGLMVVNLTIMFISKRFHWSLEQILKSKDKLWMGLLVGALGARVVFVMLNWEVYASLPVDIFKIQDKGFSLFGGLVIGCAWYFWSNKSIKSRIKIFIILIFALWIMIGVGLKHQLKTDTHYPEQSFQATNNDHSTSLEKINLRQFIGQPTVVNLWASWCPPCHREMPILEQAQDQNPNVHFIMMNQGEDIETIQNYLNKHQFSFKHVLLDTTGEMPQHINSFGLPTTLFFNADGQVVQRHMGELTPAMLKHYINKIN